MDDSISSPFEEKLPVVVIAGRPNVGKSTLFNRLVGKRTAITDPIPGVTRDPIDGMCVLGDRRIRLVDTGGYRLEGGNLDKLVSAKSMERIEAADVIVLLLDVEDITPEDEVFIDTLRPFSSRIVLAVNKVDNDKRSQNFWDFHRFGFHTVLPISAAHGHGMEDLLQAVTRLLPPAVEGPVQEEPSGDIRIAILGKPNTGKSTLLNTLLGSEKSLVTDIPGTTRDVVEGRILYREKTFVILDTAGIRRKNRVTESVEYYSVNRAVKSIDDADIVFLIVDVIEGLSDQDKKIAQLAVKKGKGIIIVMNKWDLVDDIGNRKNAESDRLRFLFPILSFAPIVFISARKGKGIDGLLKNAVKVYAQLNTAVTTGKLNKLLSETSEHHQPKGKRRYKVKYITQTGTNPVRFLLFVNTRKGFPASWTGYLKNRIRDEFGLGDIPILLELRE